MNDNDLRRLKNAFNAWAKNTPNPDEPLAGFVGGKMLSPNELAREVENETEIGKGWIEILQYGTAKEGLDKVIERLTRKQPKL